MMKHTRWLSWLLLVAMIASLGLTTAFADGPEPETPLDEQLTAAAESIAEEISTPAEPETAAEPEPAPAEAPAETEAPVVTEAPAVTDAPAETEAPVVTEAPAEPEVVADAILEQPESVTAVKGSTATFKVGVQGEVSYVRWQYSKDNGTKWTSLSTVTYGASETLRVIANNTRNGWMFRAVVYFADGSKLTSDGAKLTVVKPYISSQPKNVTTPLKTVATFHVGVEGAVSYVRWQYSKNNGQSWTNLSAAVYGISDTMSVTATKNRDGWMFRAIVYLMDGSKLTSDGAKLTLGVPQAEIETSFEAELNGVIVNVTTEDGAFDEPVALEVVPVTEGSDAYTEAENALASYGREYDGMIAIDIHFNSIATGKEVEPNSAVRVSLSFSGDELSAIPADAVDSLVLSHIADDGTVEVVAQAGMRSAALNVSDNGESVTALSADVSVGSMATAVNEMDVIVKEDAVASVAADFDVEVFSTFTVTWYYGYRQVTIHYGYLDGANGESGTFHEFPNAYAPSPTPTVRNGENEYLIYDFKDVEINGSKSDYVYYRTFYSGSADTTPAQGTTRIYPLIYNRQNNSNNPYYYRFSDGDDQNIANGSHIYVIYKAKAFTTGGTVPPPTGQTWPSDEDELPTFGKTSVDNKNGTNTISLSITAAENESTQKTKANVIIVFDNSGSMRSNMDGGAVSNPSVSSTTQAQNANTNSRLRIAYDAITGANDSFGATLFGNNPTGANASNYVVRMTYITFNTTAATWSGTWYYSNSTLKSAMGSITADGGTNWEQALNTANNIPVDSDAATFIVFVTDGEPTFRVSRGNYTDAQLESTYVDGQYYSDIQTGGNDVYYQQNGIFGNGGNDKAHGANLDFAGESVADIKEAGKDFWAVGISNDVESLQTLCTEGGFPTNQAIKATTSNAVAQALKDIAQNITTMLGFGGVQMTDGITDLSNTEMEVAGAEVDPTSFTYWRYGGSYGGTAAAPIPWTTRETDGCGPASYNEETGAVEWKMGTGFQLEDGVTYIVKFLVWPSQEAYNLVADLNNSIIRDADGNVTTYASPDAAFAALPQAQKDQLVKDETTGKYALKTNTDQVTATYVKTSETGGTVTVADDTPATATYVPGDQETMSLPTSTLNFEKIWHNVVDDRAASVVGYDEDDNPIYGATVLVTRYDKDNKAETFYSLDLRSDQDWKYENLFISVGNLSTSGNDVTIREQGYDYTITEPADYAYYWDLHAQVYHPMIINGTPTLLIKDDTATAQNVANGVYKIGNSFYRTAGTNENYLTATNDRRTNLNLTKALNGSAPEGTLFTFDAVVNLEGAKAPGADGYDANYDDVWFSVMSDTETETMAIGAVVTGEGLTAETRTVSGATYNAENNTYTYTYNGKTYTLPAADDGTGGLMYTGYYHIPSGRTATISIEAGWNVRFTNIPLDSTYTFTEQTTPGFDLADIEAEALTYDTEQKKMVPRTDYAATIDVEEHTISGSIDQSNNQVTATFTNQSMYFYVYHSASNTVERILMGDSRIVDGKFNMVDETGRNGTDTPNAAYYGGYYKAYTGAKMSDTEIVDAEYDENGWTEDTGATPYSIDIAKTDQWTFTYKADTNKAYSAKADLGTAMSPVPGTVYYLKEVPTEYLTPYAHFVYNTTGDKEITQSYLITDVDDNMYRGGGYGFKIESSDGETTYVNYTGATCSDFTLYHTKDTSAFVDKGTISEYYDEETVVTPDTVNSAISSEHGYLIVNDVSSLLEAGEEYVVTPFWKTPDRVVVYGTSYEVNTGDMTASANGISRKVDGEFKPYFE